MRREGPNIIVFTIQAFVKMYSYKSVAQTFIKHCFQPTNAPETNLEPAAFSNNVI
jgi:hypothetical protein